MISTSCIQYYQATNTNNPLLLNPGSQIAPQAENIKTPVPAQTFEIFKIKTFKSRSEILRNFRKFRNPARSARSNSGVFTPKKHHFTWNLNIFPTEISKNPSFNFTEKLKHLKTPQRFGISFFKISKPCFSGRRRRSLTGGLVLIAW